MGADCDRGDAGNVDDRKLGARRHDLFQQAFHDVLRPRTVERADDRQGEDVFPEVNVTGVDSSSSSCPWRLMIASRPFW